MRLPRLSADPPGTRKALGWSIGWTVLGLPFAGVVAALQDGQAAGEYVTGFLIEKSLSLDNLFVFAVLFSMLGVRAEDRHKVLVLGIVLAILLRDLHRRRDRRAGRLPRSDLRARRAARRHRRRRRPPRWR